MLGNKYPSARHFTSNRRALKHAHQQQQQRCSNTNTLISRQHPHRQRWQCHQQDTEREHFFAPYFVTKVRHDDPTKRASQITGGKNPEGLHLTQPLRHIDWEEEIADNRREEHENDEVVEL